MKGRKRCFVRLIIRPWQYAKMLYAFAPNMYKKETSF